VAAGGVVVSALGSAAGWSVVVCAESIVADVSAGVVVVVESAGQPTIVATKLNSIKQATSLMDTSLR
jgi:hypothetical protein